MKRTLKASTNNLRKACDDFTATVDKLVGCCRFESDKYYKSCNGKFVAHITKRTNKSVYVNTHHTDKNEAFVYLKRIKIDVEGNEYIELKNGIPVFAEFEATKGEFNQFIMRRAGMPVV